MSALRGARSIGPAKLVVLALCIGFGLAFVIANVRSWDLEDANAYWNAALRLHHGADLYPPISSADGPAVYRYAPWFAWLWIPLTSLPRQAVDIGWSALLILGGIVALWPLARMRSVAGLCLLFLLGGLLVRTASTGNVHVLLIAMLVWGLPRRSGPLWVGIAASLKFAPLAYLLVYAARREWWKAGAGFLAFAVLTAPALLYNIRDYPTDPGQSLSLFSLLGPIPWLVVAVLAAGAALLLARGVFGWSSASVAAIAATPRLDYYDLTYLLVGLNAGAQGPSVSTVDPVESSPVASSLP